MLEHSNFTIRAKEGLTPGCLDRCQLHVGRQGGQFSVAPMTDKSRTGSQVRVPGGDVHSIHGIGVTIHLLLRVKELRNARSLTAAVDQEGAQTTEDTETTSAEQGVLDPG